MSNFWDFSVWGNVILLAVLFLGLLMGHTLKRKIPALKDSLIPTSVLGGALILIFTGIYKLVTGRTFFTEPLFSGDGITSLEILTYHCLALGFIASAFKKNGDKGNKKRLIEIFDTGTATVCNYLMQALVGFAITLAAAKIIPGFFAAAGVLLPFGYGQGTGQALNYGNIYETEFGFEGGRSFGLTIAALGFLSAAIGGVIHLFILKKKGIACVKASENEIMKFREIQSEGEVPMQESMDKMTIQFAFVGVTYLIAYLIMRGLGELVPGFKSVIYGFNFLIGVLATVIVKKLLTLSKRSKFMKREYINDFLMTRISNFFFDIMVCAGIAAIRIEVLKQYWGIMLILGVAGALTTYYYNVFIARKVFPEYSEEQFLMMYGMYTGTASTGIILLRELDPEFKTPASDNMVYQNFPAIILGFPMMFLATLAPTKPLLTYIILAVFFLVLNLILFRSKLLNKITFNRDHPEC